MHLEKPLEQVPYLVVDVETTGLVPGRDRVVEIAAVKILPGEEPKVMLDTLVDPQREMAGTEIHGITDNDVDGAPTFGQLAPQLASLLAGRVLVTHNAGFDVRMLRSELGPSFAARPFPYLCTVLLHRHLRGGANRTLAEACSAFEIEHDQEPDHSAAADAVATARLLQQQLLWARKRAELRTLHDLCEDCAPLGEHLRARPLSQPAKIARAPELKRRGQLSRRPRRKSPEHRYLDALLAALEDLHVTDDELEQVRRLRDQLELPTGVVHALHAKIYTGVLVRYTEDRFLDDAERAHLRSLHRALRALGWAPGD